MEKPEDLFSFAQSFSSKVCRALAASLIFSTQMIFVSELFGHVPGSRQPIPGCPKTPL